MLLRKDADGISMVLLAITSSGRCFDGSVGIIAQTVNDSMSEERWLYQIVNIISDNGK